MEAVTKKPNVPALRFPEFSGEWQETRLGSVSKFSKGKGLSKEDVSRKGRTPCVRYAELYTTYGNRILQTVSFTDVDERELVISKGGEIVIPASGETAFDIATASCIILPGVALGGDLNVIQSSINGVFLSYLFGGKARGAIARMAQGSSVIHLYSNQLKRIKLNLPGLAEQEKVAAFLTVVDERFGLLKRKKELLEEYKKGVMQRLFSREIRFKDEEGNEYPKWEEKRLGEVGSTFGGLSGKSKEDFGRGERYVQYMQVFSSSMIDLGECDRVLVTGGEKQNRLILGDALFTTSSETPKEIGISSVVTETDELPVYLNSFCFGYRMHIPTAPHFLAYRFRAHDFRRIIAPLAQGSTRFNLSKSNFLKLSLTFPVIDEQLRIGEALLKIDNKIDRCDAQIVGLSAFKRGLLQRMFV